MRRTQLIVALLIGLMWSTGVAQAQDVIHHPESSASLSQKWDWALEEADEESLTRYWVGYSIERMMSENSFIGSWSDRGKRKTLQELIYGVRSERRNTRSWKDSERKVLKEVAVLFQYRTGSDEIRDIEVGTLDSQADLDRYPLLWLGGVDVEESLERVQRLYHDAWSVDLKEDMVFALAIHDATGKVVPILTDILTGNEASDIREQAAFWLGQTDDPEALDVLIRTAENDRSGDVREQAVFGISQMETEASTEALIDLAYNADDREVREKAIFWLGQEASDRAVEALGDFVEDDNDTAVQKQAVFALSQIDEDQGIPMLIRIARTHPKPEVRKQAIFWLGQSEDPRALDALVELVRG